MRQSYKGKPIKVIGIHAPLTELEARMLKRGDSRENVNMRLEHDEIKFGMMEDFCDIIVRNMDLADTVSTVRTYIFQTEYPAAFKHFTIGY